MISKMVMSYAHTQSRQHYKARLYIAMLLHTLVTPAARSSSSQRGSWRPCQQPRTGRLLERARQVHPIALPAACSQWTVKNWAAVAQTERPGDSTAIVPASGGKSARGACGKCCSLIDQACTAPVKCSDMVL